MLYCVQMDVRVPHDVDPARFERLKAEEKARAEELQRAGKWRHLWRVAGGHAKVSIPPVADPHEPHPGLSSPPPFPLLENSVTPPAPPPSALDSRQDKEAPDGYPNPQRS